MTSAADEILAWFDLAIEQARDDHEPAPIVEWLHDGRALAEAALAAPRQETPQP